MTTGNNVQEWLHHLEQQGKSHHTVAAYRRGVAHFATWNENSYEAPFDPAAVIPRDVRDWQAHQLRVENAAPRTINQRLVAVTRFFAWAVKRGVRNRNPATEIKSIRLPQRRPQGLSKRDLRRLLRAVHRGKNWRDIAIIELLAGTGLRVGELLNLKVGDVEINPRSGQVTVRWGKHDSYRQLPLTKDVRYALTDYLREHPQETENQPLWWGTRGPLRTRSSILRILRKYAQRADIAPFGPHVLRHTFATRYLQANPDDLRGLAALLGHRNLETVMIYTEPTLDDLTARMERLNTM